MDIKHLVLYFNKLFTLYCVFPSIVFFGLYLTIKLRFIQLSKFKLSLKYLLKKEEQTVGSLSHYQALAAVLAGNFGAGNIPGMAIALSTGGPGALIWMWIMAFLGSTIQYASCFLGGKYSRVDENKERVGGPMYYLSEGLGFKRIAILFSVFTIIGAFTAGNLTQVNAVLLPLDEIGFHPVITVLVIALLAAVVILGGVQRFASVVSSVVPAMALLYLGTTSIILFMNASKILPALKLMIEAAFDYQALIGGTLGAGVVKAIGVGFDRGLFATDSGTGLVPILQSSAKSKHPVTNGIVTLVAPFLVMIVCTCTGLVLIVTGAWQKIDVQSTNMVTWAFNKGLNNSWGQYIVMVALAMFAYTTILAWASSAEKAVNYIWGLKGTRMFRYVFIAFIPLSLFVPGDFAWVLSDVSISLMLSTNLIGVVALSKQVIRESNEYFALEERDAPPSCANVL